MQSDGLDEGSELHPQSLDPDCRDIPGDLIGDGNPAEIMASCDEEV